MTTCRRILKEVADELLPDDQAGDGDHRLTEDNYRKRLTEFVRQLRSRRYREVMTASVEDLYQRFNALDGLASKAVHATIALEDAEFCALSTYLLGAELVRVKAMLTQDDQDHEGVATDLKAYG